MTSEAIVTSHDKERVIEHIRKARSSWATYAPYLEWFRAGLKEIRTVSPHNVPQDIITMNSQFEVKDLRTEERTCYTLVYPEDEKLDAGNLCVLSPMGAAILGARVGQVVHWRGATAINAVEVTRLLYQPESAGDIEL